MEKDNKNSKKLYKYLKNIKKKIQTKKMCPRKKKKKKTKKSQNFKKLANFKNTFNPMLNMTKKEDKDNQIIRENLGIDNIM